MDLRLKAIKYYLTSKQSLRTVEKYLGLERVVYVVGWKELKSKRGKRKNQTVNWFSLLVKRFQMVVWKNQGFAKQDKNGIKDGIKCVKN